jgi:hypothetical protein
MRRFLGMGRGLGSFLMHIDEGCVVFIYEVFPYILKKFTYGIFSVQLENVYTWTFGYHFVSCSMTSAARGLLSYHAIETLKIREDTLRCCRMDTNSLNVLHNSNVVVTGT